MDDDGVLGQAVEVRDALDQDVAAGRHARDLAFAYGLVDGEQRVGIVAHTQHLWRGLADDARGFVGGELVEELAELGVGGKGGLDGDDDVGGEVCDACDCVIVVSTVTLQLNTPPCHNSNRSIIDVQLMVGQSEHGVW